MSKQTYHFFHIGRGRLGARFSSFFETIGDLGTQLIVDSQNVLNVLICYAIAENTAAFVSKSLENGRIRLDIQRSTF